ncbi:b(0,+)-type amino acid transporter 1-like [Mercenaria mercenaria]|uniref:b(0,+)-type amino acid transporter 1-like n=1 Tax=Mercenaria mercenaria TaxID=6596 RepID=UPI00234F458B|nr:b(0,+)-type amino acid transporter 1-like [Mercenaria mercenaria]
MGLRDMRQRNPSIEIEYEIEPVVRLKRNVGIISAISFIVGTIIGSGIFISPKGVLTETGSIGLSLTVWVSSGIIMILGTLSYGELGTMIPKSGGEYHYLMEATFPVVAFLFSWKRTIVLQPSAVSTNCLTFASYMTTFFDYCGSPELHEKMIAILTIWQVFILIPIVFTACSLFLVIAPFIRDPRLEFLWASLFIAGGLLFYFPFVVFKLDNGCLDKVTMFLQLICQVAPSPYTAEDHPGKTNNEREKCETNETAEDEN